MRVGWLGRVIIFINVAVLTCEQIIMAVNGVREVSITYFGQASIVSFNRVLAARFVPSLTVFDMPSQSVQLAAAVVLADSADVVDRLDIMHRYHVFSVGGICIVASELFSTYRALRISDHWIE